jgi:hypothetical protein
MRRVPVPGTGPAPQPDQPAPLPDPVPAGRGWRRWKVAAGVTLAGAALFCAYLRLSGTSAVNSDSSNILLMAWDMLHGNVLLHGWYMSDVSFYSTELPQYALLESFLGLHPETAHVAAAMTYTLSVLLAVLLARRGESGRAALSRMLLAGGIMVAPQLGVGVYALDMAVGHIGTSVPLLLIWLLLDRYDRVCGPAPRRWAWGVPPLTALLLAWALVADPIVSVVGVAPLALIGAFRFVRGVAARRGSSWVQRAKAEWYPLALAVAAVAAFALARLAIWLIGSLGGFAVHQVPFVLQWRQRDFLALWRLLQLYGADYRGLVGASFAFAILHLVCVALVALSVFVVAGRFGGRPLVDQVLLAGIALNVLLYAISTTSAQGAHEIAVVAPMGAALAARNLTWRIRRPRLLLAGYAAGALLLASYLAGLGYELTQPSVPPENSTLTSWLAAHGLTNGLAGYWQASSVTVASGGRVTIRPLAPQSMRPYLWMSKASWYDPASYNATFIVIDTQTPYYATWLPRATIKKYEGTPVRTYHTGPYTILVWQQNLLPAIPEPGAPQPSTATILPGL